jgi:short-subunit dehydrogenase
MSRNRSPIDEGQILITGASAGIGRELARQLAPRARRLILVARRRERLEELQGELTRVKPGLEVDLEACDIGDATALRELCERILNRHGGPDILINNAGLGDLALYEQADWARIEQIVQVNVLAPLLLTHRLLPPMVERRRGGILMVGSGAGFNPMPGAATYAGSKHFMNGWTESLLAELDGTGVVVTQVAPGPVATEFDAAAGIPEGGLAGGADAFMKISAEQAAREAIAGFDEGRALVLPGWKYRAALAFQARVPLRVRRAMARSLARRVRERLSGREAAKAG